jgi:Tfp pilus assembly protein PilX
MKRSEIGRSHNNGLKNDPGQKGSAIVISLFVLALITVFVALALSRSSAEAAASGNESAEGRTFYAAQGSLETMTRNFNKVFEVKLNPTTTELDAVRNGTVAGLSGYTFTQELDQTSTRSNVVLSGGPFAGLYAIRDNWRLRTTATNNIGVQVQLTRNVLNNRIPIFQFGIFYDDDLELFRPPRFSFGGRVHSNRNFFLSPGAEGVYFNSRVTTVGHIVTQTWRNWATADSGNNQTFIKNASGTDQQLLPTMGSVLNTTVGAANNIFSADASMPPSKLNTSFTTQSSIFDGNLQNLVKPLKLPIKIDSDTTDLIEMIKRPKKIADASGGDLFTNSAGTLAPVTAATADSDILKEERFGNKAGIRISLADSKAKLPGCASGTGTTAITGPCGVRLDGYKDGTGPVPSPTPSATPDRARGYQPKGMKLNSAASTYAYVPTRANGERLYTGGTREVWIKVETVDSNAGTGVIITKDITEDFLSLGITEAASTNIAITTYSGTRADNGTATSPSANITATSAQTATTYPDSRSVIKLQRFEIFGPAIPNTGNYLYSYGSGTSAINVVRRYSGVTAAEAAAGCASGCTARNANPNTGLEHYAHLYRATLNGTADEAVVPFPIEMFDSREGEYYDDASRYTSGQVTQNGTMSMIDIDVANLRRFLRGDFDGLFQPSTNFPSGLRSTDVPNRQGWVVYVSDRRGDADFDGQYDMEDVYGNSPGNDGVLQANEDVNGNGVLDAKYYSSDTSESCISPATTCEAAKYSSSITPDFAAVDDQKYFRRGVRLINGTTIPGIYDTATPSNTRGFTFASENGVYVRGNYNATGVNSVPSTGNSAYSEYRPFNTSMHIPASVVADAVTILSNSWNDAESFATPYDADSRVASTTTVRFAMIAGDTLANRDLSPGQGGSGPWQSLNGGVHNFKRYLETWSGQRLDFSGSLVNLFVSQNNNGTFKCCNTVYNPPDRNWVFDSTFLDPDRLPPGTPYFQYIQTTGFQKTNN